MASAKRLADELRSFLDLHPEWLIERNRAASFYARASEICFRSEEFQTIFTFPFDKGAEQFNVADCWFGEGEVVLDVYDESDGIVEEIRIIRRRPQAELRAETEQARIERANRIARSFGEILGRGRVTRVRLEDDVGRVAEIIFEDALARQWVAVADVSQALSPERLLSTAVLLLDKLSKRKRRPLSRIGVIGNKRQCSTIRKLLALMSEVWRSRIDIYECRDAPGADEVELEELVVPPVTDVFSESIGLFGMSGTEAESETAKRAKSLDAAVDIIRFGQGETVRFHGLPFARIRSIAGREVMWCGVGRRRVVEPADYEMVLAETAAELADRRRADAADRRHEFFRLAPEAWLESLLRKDIKRLDPNLLLSPVHEQFRTGREKVDLLALRSDGRLVIIEVKVTADRDMAYQSLDYWRKIEALRRSGAFDGRRLFGKHDIADRPAIVYLVAPTLSFAPETELFLSTVSEDVEICRFELVENWRKEVKVSRRIT